MNQYLELLRKIRDTGTVKTDRTGTGTVSIFGPQMRFNLAEGFPLLTTKKLHLKSIIHELLWLIKGDTNIKYLVDNGVNIWNDWPLEAYNKHLMKRGLIEPCTMATFIEYIKLDYDSFAERWGELGPVYGKQWRAWSRGDGMVIDQLREVIDTLRRGPDSRRMVVSAWNVADLPQMTLSPCHALFQFYTVPLTHQQRLAWYHANKTPEKWQHCARQREAAREKILDKNNTPLFRLDCQLYQRSADTFLGVPFNVASYALLTMMMAQVVNMMPGEFIWTGGDTHIYQNHLEQVELQLSRETRALPTMTLNPSVTDLFSFKFEDFTLTNYNPHPGIKAAVSV